MYNSNEFVRPAFYILELLPCWCPRTILAEPVDADSNRELGDLHNRINNPDLNLKKLIPVPANQSGGRTISN
jgi:hypothetical protein